MAVMAYRILLPLFFALFAHVCSPCTNQPWDGGSRLVLYFQTTHDSHGSPISLLPLITEQGIGLTHLIIASFHINVDSEIHLNDHLPSEPIFATLWSEVEALKAAGIKVLGMVGGAAQGSYSEATLDGNQATFSKYYGQLKEEVQRNKLQGLDLDIEEGMSQGGITRLIRELRKDFGPEFLITLSPVASALQDGANPSGFSYATLEADVGSDIAFYNAQFYSGYGNISTSNDYDDVVSRGWKPSKIVIGQLTTPANGHGYTSIYGLKQTVNALRGKYGRLGGVMGWEYFNSEPGGVQAPWQWARAVTAIIST